MNNSANFNTPSHGPHPPGQHNDEQAGTFRGEPVEPGVPNTVSASARLRPEKLYRIGEVVDYAGTSRQTIHNYTIMGLLRETRWTAGGHRLYDESVFERLDQIAGMKRQQRSLQEIREHFARSDASAPTSY